MKFLRNILAIAIALCVANQASAAQESHLKTAFKGAKTGAWMGAVAGLGLSTAIVGVEASGLTQLSRYMHFEPIIKIFEGVEGNIPARYKDGATSIKVLTSLIAITSTTLVGTLIGATIGATRAAIIYKSATNEIAVPETPIITADKIEESTENNA